MSEKIYTGTPKCVGIRITDLPTAPGEPDNVSVAFDFVEVLKDESGNVRGELPIATKVVAGVAVTEHPNYDLVRETLKELAYAQL